MVPYLGGSYQTTTCHVPISLQAEQRNEIWLKERQKQKEEAQLARNEVRAKLEQDRREREDRNQTGMYISVCVPCSLQVDHKLVN